VQVIHYRVNAAEIEALLLVATVLADGFCLGHYRGQGNIDVSSFCFHFVPPVLPVARRYRNTNRTTTHPAMTRMATTTPKFKAKMNTTNKPRWWRGLSLEHSRDEPGRTPGQ
jgi:hypothetical protein